MKLLIWTILASVLLSFVSAEITKFDTEVEIRIENNTIYIEGGDQDYERELDFDANFTLEDWEKDFSFTWYENVSCESDIQYFRVSEKMDDMEESVTTLAEDINQFLEDNENYYELYSTCHTERSTCQTENTANSEYQSQYEECENTLSLREAAYTRLQTEKTDIEKSSESCDDDFDSCKDNRTLLFIIAIALGISTAVMFFKYSRPFSKRKANPHDNSGRPMDNL